MSLTKKAKQVIILARMVGHAPNRETLPYQAQAVAINLLWNYLLFTCAAAGF